MLTCTPIDLSCLDVEGVLNANVHTNRPLLSGCGGKCSMLTMHTNRPLLSGCGGSALLSGCGGSANMHTNACLDVEGVLNANVHTNRPLLSGCLDVHTNRPLLSECSMLMWRCTPIDLSCLDVEEVLNANMHTNRPLFVWMWRECSIDL